MVDIPTVPVSDNVEEDQFETLRLGALADHHELLCDALQDVADGKTPYLMVFMPPGSAKSTYVDVVFVPWFMARKPKQNVILTSYGSDLARKQGRRARQLVKSRSFCNLFDARLSTESSAADEWSLTNGSEYMAGGILSGVTGNRADLLVVDDPVKGREEAESDTIRKKTKEAFEDDLATRLKPGGRIVVIQTRWHEADLSGEILPERWNGESGVFEGRDGRTWRVICIPAEARENDVMGRKAGQMLWPEWFTAAHWKPFRANARTWSALYQQMPQPEEGTFFKKEWFRRFDARPQHLRYYMTSDHAPGDGDGTDWNVFRIWGIDQHQHVYAVDGYRTQETLDKALGIEADESGDMTLLPFGGLPLIKKWKPLCWFPEDDNNWKASKAFVIAAMRRLGCHCRIEALSPHGQDKPTKARAIQAKASMGEVWFPSGPIGDAITDECIRFPAGRNDDEVDALSLIGRAIDQAHPAIIAQAEQKTGWDGPHRPSWRRKKEGGDSWKTL